MDMWWEILMYQYVFTLVTIFKTLFFTVCAYMTMKYKGEKMYMILLLEGMWKIMRAYVRKSGPDI
jgi:hypothetical protein